MKELRWEGGWLMWCQEANQEVPKEMLKFDLRIKGSTFNKFFNKDGSNEAPRQCFQCGDTGHTSRFCPQGGGGGGGRGGSSFRGRGGGRGFSYNGSGAGHFSRGGGNRGR